MNGKAPRDMAASVRARLMNVAKANNEAFDKFGAAAFGLKDGGVSSSIDIKGKSKNKDDNTRYSSNVSRSKYDSTQKKKTKDSYTPKKNKS